MTFYEWAQVFFKAYNATILSVGFYLLCFKLVLIMFLPLLVSCPEQYTTSFDLKYPIIHTDTNAYDKNLLYQGSLLITTKI